MICAIINNINPLIIESQSILKAIILKQYNTTWWYSTILLYFYVFHYCVNVYDCLVNQHAEENKKVVQMSFGAEFMIYVIIVQELV